MVMQLKVKNKFKSAKTGYEYYTLVDEYGNEAGIKSAYVCEELMPGDICLFKLGAGYSNGKSFLVFNFLRLLKRDAVEV